MRLSYIKDFLLINILSLATLSLLLVLFNIEESIIKTLIKSFLYVNITSYIMFYPQSKDYRIALKNKGLFSKLSAYDKRIFIVRIATGVAISIGMVVL